MVQFTDREGRTSTTPGSSIGETSLSTGGDFNFYVNYTSVGGRVWSNGEPNIQGGASQGFSSNLPTNDMSLLGLDADEVELFREESFKVGGADLVIVYPNIQPGSYVLSVFLREGFHNSIGQRIYQNIEVNGEIFAVGLDLFALYGDDGVRLDQNFIVASDGLVTITLRTTIENPLINALSFVQIPSVTSDNYLVEDGDFLLLEGGDNLLLESSGSPLGVLVPFKATSSVRVQSPTLELPLQFVTDDVVQPTLSQSPNLIPDRTVPTQSVIQSQPVSNVDFIQGSVWSPNSVVQQQLVEVPTFIQAHVYSPEKIVQAQSVQSTTLGGLVFTLDVQGALQAQPVQIAGLGLPQYLLSVQGTAQSQVVQGVIFGDVRFTLIPQSVLQQQNVQLATLQLEGVLLCAPVSHITRTQETNFLQDYVLSINNSVQSQIVDSSDFILGYIVNSNSVLNKNIVGQPIISAGYPLLVEGSVQKQILQVPSFTQAYIWSPDSTRQVQKSGQPFLVEGVLLVSEDRVIIVEPTERTFKIIR